LVGVVQRTYYFIGDHSPVGKWNFLQILTPHISLLPHMLLHLETAASTSSVMSSFFNGSRRETIASQPASKASAVFLLRSQYATAVDVLDRATGRPLQVNKNWVPRAVPHTLMFFGGCHGWMHHRSVAVQ
jgi:hypothetical protein